MTVRESLNQWLQGPRRDYAEGLVLFDILADGEMKARYGQFLHEVDKALPSDAHANMLWNKLDRLAQIIRCNPVPFQYLLSKDFSGPSAAPSEIRGDLSADTARIERPGHGVKVVRFQDLPENLQPKYERIRELQPLRAKLHSELSSSNGDAAAAIADDLCKVDDELRRLWDELDAWADGKAPEQPKEDSDVVKGMELTRREKKLRDNIRNNRNLVTKYEEQGDAAAAAKARERLAAYEKEMEELKKRIADEEAAS